MNVPAPTCFIAMPLTTSESQASEYGDVDHWEHVLEVVHVPAVERAGYKAIRPIAEGTQLIHANIVTQLVQADMVLFDLSCYNANVMFELGIRTALDLPIALVKDQYAPFVFDTGVLNTHQYDGDLASWHVAAQVDEIAQHLTRAAETCGSTNPMWQRFGIEIRAAARNIASSDGGEMLTLILAEVQRLSSTQKLLFERSGPVRALPVDEVLGHIGTPVHYHPNDMPTEDDQRVVAEFIKEVEAHRWRGLVRIDPDVRRSVKIFTRAMNQSTRKKIMDAGREAGVFVMFKDLA